MALPLAAASWIAPVITAVLLALPAVVLWRLERRRRPEAAGEDPAGEKAPEVRFEPPGRLPPVGRVSWDVFEREFAAYVERSERPDDPDRTAR